MGTGAVALAFAVEAATWHWPWLDLLAKAGLILASLLAIVLLPRYLVRARSRSDLATEIADPGHGAMLATLPAGLLVLASAWGRIGPTLIPVGAALTIDAVLLVIGAVLALAIGLGWATTMLRTSPGLAGVNGGWLIPPVMNLLVPLGLAPLIVANPGAAAVLTMTGLAFYGIGALLFLAILPLLVARLAVADPLPAGMAPSLWIPLAPAGVIGLSLIRLLQAASAAKVDGFGGATAGLVVAAMGLGFGLWWAAFAWLDVRRMRRNGPLPIHPGWWGFVFPVGAMTLSMATVGQVAQSTVINVIGLAMTVILTALWLYVAARTVRLAGASKQASHAPVPR